MKEFEDETKNQKRADSLLDGVQASWISFLSFSGDLRLPFITALIPAGGLSVSKDMKITCMFEAYMRQKFNICWFNFVRGSLFSSFLITQNK